MRYRMGFLPSLTSRIARPARERVVSRPRLELLEGRALLATLAQVPNVNVPQYMGYQMPLEGGSGNAQTYTVTSSNPKVAASVAQGQFWTINVSHTSSGAGDPSFNGSLTFQLFEDLTPLTTSRIETLINQGFYTDKNFHRIADMFPGTDDYIVQGGSPDGKGSGEVNQPGFPFADEFVQQLAFTGQGFNNDPNSIYSVAGQLAMANAGDDTNSSQFFATTGSPRFLDYQHTIFGQLVSGQQTLEQMTKVALNGTTPVNPIVITSTSLAGTSPDGVVHIDTSAAEAGETATITVTARDPLDNTTVTRTFQVAVQANPTQERPFLQPVANQVVGVTQTTPTVQGQSAVFQLDAVNPNPPGTAVTYVVQGSVSGSTFLPVQNATATVDASGVVRVTPNPGFTGVINLVVGVGGPSANVSTPTDFDTQAMTVTVVNGAEVNLAPIAIDGTSSAVINTPSPIQLSGDTANPASSQTLTYQIVSGPSSGTISQFNAQTGAFLYTGNPGFQGTDSVTFRVTDVGAPLPNLTSGTATQTILVGGGQTGLVRLIDDVLVVNAPPRTDSVPNEIRVEQTAEGLIVVTVNGLIDSTQPEADMLTKIVVYGSKANDNIEVVEGVSVPATINGGQGGTNNIVAAGVMSRTHVWFGNSRVRSGRGQDLIYGRAGQFRVARGGSETLIFAGVPNRRASLHKAGAAPAGTFYQFVDGVPVKVPTPPPRRLRGATLFRDAQARRLGQM